MIQKDKYDKIIEIFKEQSKLFEYNDNIFILYNDLVFPLVINNENKNIICKYEIFENISIGFSANPDEGFKNSILSIASIIFANLTGNYFSELANFILSTTNILFNSNNFKIIIQYVLDRCIELLDADGGGFYLQFENEKDYILKYSKGSVYLKQTCTNMNSMLNGKNINLMRNVDNSTIFNDKKIKLNLVCAKNNLPYGIKYFLVVYKKKELSVLKIIDFSNKLEVLSVLLSIAIILNYSSLVVKERDFNASVVDNIEKFVKKINTNNYHVKILLLTKTKDVAKFLKQIIDSLEKRITVIIDNENKAIEVLKHEFYDFIIVEGNFIEFYKCVLEYMKDRNISLSNLILIDNNLPEKTKMDMIANGVYNCLPFNLSETELAYRINAVLSGGKESTHLVKNFEYIKSYFNNIGAELKLASEIQSDFFPSTHYSDDNFNVITYKYHPNVVSGDGFEIFKKGKTSIYSILDVSGHNISSAMILMMIKVLFRRVRFFDQSLSESIRAFNRMLYNHMVEDFYVTGFFIKAERRKFSFLRVGIEPAVLIKNGKFSLLEHPSSPVGLGLWTDNFDIKASDFVLINKGDKIITFSDGFFDNLSLVGVTKEVVYEVIKNSASMKVGELFDILRHLHDDHIREVREYAKLDDATMSVIEFN